MDLHLPNEWAIPGPLQRTLSSVDQLRGEWNVIEHFGHEKLSALRRIATIESAASSTRIEGSQLTDNQVEELFARVKKQSFQTRDEQEVAGYAHVIREIQENADLMSVTNGIIQQLHRDLLQFSTKDERHRGDWKTLPNHVAAFDAAGRQIGIIFETATPLETPMLMDELTSWFTEQQLHPLVAIGVFHVAFLAIHPFQDGNGRLARILTNLQLLQAGYHHAAYSSLESAIEHNKEQYYLSLRKTQISFGNDQADWMPWLTFFLQTLEQQADALRDRLKLAGVLPDKGTISVEESRSLNWGDLKIAEGASLPPEPAEELSRLAQQLLTLMKEQHELSVAEAVKHMGANRNTLKTKFSELVDQGHVERMGAGRGSYYRIRSSAKSR
ncbi:MAG: Fic family protein [Verrucomicrobiota bacterium]